MDGPKKWGEDFSLVGVKATKGPNGKTFNSFQTYYQFRAELEEDFRKKGIEDVDEVFVIQKWKQTRVKPFRKLPR